jgi:hypothetical protein
MKLVDIWHVRTWRLQASELGMQSRSLRRDLW